MSTPKYNSKGQLIEELDCPPIYMRGPFQSPKPTSPKRAPQSQTPEPKPDVVISSAEPFPNAQQSEILAWCEAYQDLKKRGINIYKI